MYGFVFTELKTSEETTILTVETISAWTCWILQIFFYSGRKKVAEIYVCLYYDHNQINWICVACIRGCRNLLEALMIAVFRFTYLFMVAHFILLLVFPILFNRTLIFDVYQCDNKLNTKPMHDIDYSGWCCRAFYNPKHY